MSNERSVLYKLVDAVKGILPGQPLILGHRLGGGPVDADVERVKRLDPCWRDDVPRPGSLPETIDDQRDSNLAHRGHRPVCRLEIDRYETEIFPMASSNQVCGS